MAYTLKTSGIATNLVMCNGVDEDGTITEFVSSDVQANRTLDTGVAASVATGSWKGTARKYWVSVDNSGVPAGVLFAAGHRPTLALTNANGVTYFCAFHGSSARTGDGGYISHSTAGDGQQAGLTLNSAANTCLMYGAGLKGGGSTTAVPTNGTTKFSIAVSYKDSGTPSDRYHYGLESGSLAADGTSDTHGGASSSAADVYGIGGLSGFGAIGASRYLDCIFNIELSLAERQSLHDDWFGTLFNAPAGGTAGIRRSLLGIG